MLKKTVLINKKLYDQFLLKIVLFIVLSIFFLISCSSEFQSFNDKAYKFVNDDKKISQKEFETLLKDISNSTERGFIQFKDENGNIKQSTVVSYLLKYYTAKNLNLTEDDIWKPESLTKLKTFNINVFLENSASMDGYVKGVTDFETAIYNLLGDFKINDICDSLNLNYINNSIPYSKKNALPSDIQDFIEKLEPSTFQQKGGDRSSSDLKNIINSVLNTVDDQNVAVLISDFVFSPGNNENAQDYLNNQSVGIKIDFAEKIKRFDLSAIIIQLESNFNGKYYDKTDKPIWYQGKRPYYIWILGNHNQIQSIIDKKILDNIKGGFLNKLVLQSTDKTYIPNYKILSNQKIGDFSRSELNNYKIIDATLSKSNKNKGIFGFSIAVDFSKNLQDSNYFLDTTNYILSNPNYQLDIEVIENSPEYTHLLKLQTNDLKDEKLDINIIGKIPDWIYSSSSIDDSNILNDKEEQHKTFGLKHLMEGVCDAFYPKTKTNAINTLTITIKK